MNIEIPKIELIPPVIAPEEESKIVSMRGDSLAIQSKRKEANAKYCASHHKNIYVDEDERIIECSECGKVLDPFDYLFGWAREGDRRMERLKFLDDEVRRKHNELSIVTAALAREKARVRKINPDAPEVITWRREMERRKIGPYAP